MIKVIRNLSYSAAYKQTHSPGGSFSGDASSEAALKERIAKLQNHLPEGCYSQSA